MFTQASVRLAAWYITILLAICLLFSFLIYQSASNEVQARFSAYTTKLNSQGYHIVDFESLQDRQLEQARQNILGNLMIINLTIILLGGIASFFMANRTLHPIEQVHESERRFVADASHELRTPLAVIKTEVEVALADKSTTKAEMRQLLASNLDEVNRLVAMSQTLLSMSKHEYTALDFTKVNLAELVKMAADRSESPERFKLTLPKKPYYITANLASIDELIVVLLSNAIQHSPADTPISVTVRSQPRSMALVVRNQGKGISKSDLPHIFERFYRADKSRSDSTSFGLGLALAKQITDLHGGDIHATSTPGKTTSLIVNLPKNH